MVLHSGYVKVSLRIQHFPAYQEDVLMLVILDSKYTYRVPIQLGTRVIGNLVKHIGLDNLAQVARLGEMHSSVIGWQGSQCKGKPATPI